MQGALGKGLVSGFPSRGYWNVTEVNCWENISHLAEYNFRKVRQVKTVDTITLDIRRFTTRHSLYTLTKYRLSTKENLNIGLITSHLAGGRLFFCGVVVKKLGVNKNDQRQRGYYKLPDGES